MSKKIKIISTFVILLLALPALYFFNSGLLDDLPVGKGYAAKYLCSYVFNSDFDEQQVIDRYIAKKVKPLPLIWTVDVDHDAQEVRVGDKFLGDDAVAFYKEGKGCTLLIDRTREEVAAIPFTPSTTQSLPADQPWPHGSGPVVTAHRDIDMGRIQNAADALFSHDMAHTTSVVVIHKGELIFERYGQGASKDTRLLGWSMTKTLTGMLIGKLADQGVLDLDAPAPIREWAQTDRADITTRQLVNMTGGVLVNEDYTKFSDVTQMLYLESDQHGYAVNQPKVHPAGEHFAYSTAETNRLAAIIQQHFGSQQAVYDFYQQELFYPLGITDGFIEFDAHGQLVGGAYGFLKARDWARIGQLYLQGGEWNGEQVLSKEWVDFALAESEQSPIYSGQLWINAEKKRWKDVPDVRYLSGHQGQRVVMIPSHDLVIVRTGITEDHRLQRRLIGNLIRDVMASVPTTTSSREAQDKPNS
ncbi:MAG: serine hydrolase [Pseudomonadota bacterium]|nr:serine hydrolase [Pseudomonadota bacterium]